MEKVLNIYKPKGNALCPWLYYLLTQKTVYDNNRRNYNKISGSAHETLRLPKSKLNVLTFSETSPRDYYKYQTNQWLCPISILQDVFSLTASQCASRKILLMHYEDRHLYHCIYDGVCDFWPSQKRYFETIPNWRKSRLILRAIWLCMTDATKVYVLLHWFPTAQRCKRWNLWNNTSLLS